MQFGENPQMWESLNGEPTNRGGQVYFQETILGLKFYPVLKCIKIFYCAFSNPQVLLSVSKSQVDKIIESLDKTQLDVLMKYIYRGFEKPSEGSSATLLLWHEKVYNVGGVGCIVRVLTDRKRV